MNTEQIKKLWEAYVEVSEKKEQKLDPVNDKENDKKFKDRKDKDIDNDGDVDSSDEYLHKRRAATDDAIDARKEKEKKGMNSKQSDKTAEISKIGEAKMDDSEVLSAAKKLASNGKDEKTKEFGQGLVDFYDKNKSFTPDQVAGLQNIMKNASFQMAKEEVELDEAKMKVGDTVRIHPKSKNISDRKKLGKSGYIKSVRGKDYLVKFADGSSILAQASDLEMVKEDTLGEAFEMLWSAIQEASEPKNRKGSATEPEGIMDKESPKSKEFADKHKKSEKEYEEMPKDAAEKTTEAGRGVKSQAPARSGDNMKGDKKVVNPVKEDTRSERNKIMDILSGKTWGELRDEHDGD